MTLAQEKGYVSASLESTNHFYVNDPVNDNFSITEDLPQIKEGGFYASNNYLKVDYYKGRFSAGTQIEGYFPFLVGYPTNLNNMALSNLYANWRDESYSVTVGTFYDQFGSGLLFRSWEDRTLGLNNAIVGARATYNFKNYASVKVLWGIPRLGTGNNDGQFFGFGLTKVNVAGADLSVSLSDIFSMDKTSLSVEGSVLNKHEAVSDLYAERGYRPNMFGWSGRVNFDYDGFFAKGEYVDAGKQMLAANRPPVKGNAQLIELGYNGRGLGVTVTGRRMQQVLQKIYTYDRENRNFTNRPLTRKIRTAKYPKPNARQQIPNISSGSSRAAAVYSAVAKASRSTKGSVRFKTVFFSASTPSRVRKPLLRHSIPSPRARNTGRAVSSTATNPLIDYLITPFWTITLA
jgi:hypothetical protein